MSVNQKTHNMTKLKIEYNCKWKKQRGLSIIYAENIAGKIMCVRSRFCVLMKSIFMRFTVCTSNRQIKLVFCQSSPTAISILFSCSFSLYLRLNRKIHLLSVNVLSFLLQFNNFLICF